MFGKLAKSDVRAFGIILDLVDDGKSFMSFLGLFGLEVLQFDREIAEKNLMNFLSFFHEAGNEFFLIRLMLGELKCSLLGDSLVLDILCCRSDGFASSKREKEEGTNQEKNFGLAKSITQVDNLVQSRRECEGASDFTEVFDCTVGFSSSTKLVGILERSVVVWVRFEERIKFLLSFDI